MYGKSKPCKVVKNPTPANRSMNKPVKAQKNPSAANKSLNKSVSVSPSKKKY